MSFDNLPNACLPPTRAGRFRGSAAPPDRHGYFSLGLHADHTAAMSGHLPFFPEVSHAMPRTAGANQVHISEVVGWCEGDYPLIEVPPVAPRPTDERCDRPHVSR